MSCAIPRSGSGSATGSRSTTSSATASANRVLATPPGYGGSHDGRIAVAQEARQFIELRVTANEWADGARQVRPQRVRSQRGG
jgi:hypothetical protein